MKFEWKNEYTLLSLVLVIALVIGFSIYLTNGKISEEKCESNQRNFCRDWSLKSYNDDQKSSIDYTEYSNCGTPTKEICMGMGFR